VRDRVTFGVFEFDPASGELTRSGTPVRLQPQPARVLALLTERAGAVVSRDELRQNIWADGTFVDFERGLNFCIAQIRSALGDDADAPRFVETLPRRGYRFIAPIGPAGARQTAAPTPEMAPNQTPANAPPSVVRPAPRSLAASAALALFAVATAFLVAGSWWAGDADHRVRIAVVPFDNETGSDDFDAVARGVADATVARLAAPDRIGRLSVIGNAAALYQPRAFRDLKRIGTSLNADYIVLAQMKKDAAKVRLIAHLIRVDDQRHVWANTFDRPAFTLDVQSEIAESIAAAVVATLAKPSSHRT
jgi:DNA-binding winged helix-turn-helix (wHTH) protein/TolB-like protein